MRKMFAAAVLMLCVAAPAVAQIDVVAHVKGDLQARGVSLSGICGAFEVTKRVAWELRGAGWGLIAKNGGDNCGGFSGDKLVSTTGRFVDVLVDQGGNNTPSWQERPATPEELAARVEPLDPGDVAPVPASGPLPAPGTVVAAVDLSRIEAQIAQLAEQQQKNHLELVAAVNEPAWYAKLFGNRWVQLAGGVLGTCLASPDCRASVLNIGSPAK